MEDPRTYHALGESMKVGLCGHAWDLSNPVGFRELVTCPRCTAIQRKNRERDIASGIVLHRMHPSYIAVCNTSAYSQWISNRVDFLDSRAVFHMGSEI